MAAQKIMDLTRQFISFVGALLILIGCAGHQMGRINARRPPHTILNAAGSLILSWIALHPFHAGFIMLRGVWTIIGRWRWSGRAPLEPSWKPEACTAVSKIVEPLIVTK